MVHKGHKPYRNYVRTGPLLAKTFTSRMINGQWLKLSMSTLQLSLCKRGTNAMELCESCATVNENVTNDIVGGIMPNSKVVLL